MVDLTLKNDKNMSFTVNCEDSEANARLRGCRMFAQKRGLTVSIIE